MKQIDFYCFDINIPFNYLKKEIKILNDDKLIYYDNHKHAFLNSDKKEINISGKTIFARTGYKQINNMNNEIIINNGIPFLTNDEVKMVISWPAFYMPKRKFMSLYGRDLIDKDKIIFIEATIGKEIFIKTKEKDFSSVITTSLLRDNKCVFYKALNEHLNDTFFISEKVDVLDDKYGLKEYRLFVINNDIYNISRKTTDIMHRIEPQILNEATKIVEKLKDKFPSSYVMDMFVYNKNGHEEIDVVEFNPIHCSGIYLYNSVINKSNDLLHQNIKNVASEFKSEKNLKTHGKIEFEERNINNVKNSFTNTLQNIYVNNSCNFKYNDIKLSNEVFASHESLIEKSVSILTDEDLLSNKNNIKGKSLKRK